MASGSACGPAVGTQGSCGDPRTRPSGTGEVVDCGSQSSRRHRSQWMRRIPPHLLGAEPVGPQAQLQPEHHEVLAHSMQPAVRACARPWATRPSTDSRSPGRRAEVRSGLVRELASTRVPLCESGWFSRRRTSWRTIVAAAARDSAARRLTPWTRAGSALTASDPSDLSDASDASDASRISPHSSRLQGHPARRTRPSSSLILP